MAYRPHETVVSKNGNYKIETFFLDNATCYPSDLLEMIEDNHQLDWELCSSLASTNSPPAMMLMYRRATLEK